QRAPARARSPELGAQAHGPRHGGRPRGSYTRALRLRRRGRRATAAGDRPGPARGRCDARARTRAARRAARRRATGALPVLPRRAPLAHARRAAMTATTHTMVCGFCSTGCGLQVLLHGDEAVALTPAPHYPVNLGMACPKGWEALAPLRAPGRALSPLVRRGRKHVAVSWQDAVFEMVTRFKAVQNKHGNAAVAWLGTGQLPTEELALLGALGKFGMGVVHGDGNTRQCMATAATA